MAATPKAATPKDDAKSREFPRARDAGKSGVSTIGQDLVITGDVTSRGEIHLDGHVQGDIRCVALVLGESSRLEGNVAAEDVVVRGCLIGSVHAERVTLASTAHVEGDLFHRSLAMEQGAYFEGKASRAKDQASPGEATPTHRTAAKPEVRSERADKRRDRPATAFARSLSQSD